MPLGWLDHCNLQHCASSCVCLMWNPKFAKTKILEDVFQYIHCTISVMNYSFLLTICYRDNHYIRRRDLWEHLYAFPMVIREPWMVAGDFNVVRWTYEKNGGATPHPLAMAEFNDCVMQLHLMTFLFKAQVLLGQVYHKGIIMSNVSLIEFLLIKNV